MPNAPQPGPKDVAAYPGSTVGSPLTSEGSRPPDGAPLAISSFVGRKREKADLCGMLAGGTRLITLTGPGGTGKTRLALAVGFEAAGGFEDGVWWVELAPVSDPDLVPQAVAQVLNVYESPGRPLTDAIADDLGALEILLVLDNCEHLVDACARLADALLRACPGLVILATSREALGIAGERNFPVPPLSLPRTERLPAFGNLADYEAIRLFVDRARAVVPGFDLTEHNAPAVARLCRRLDGIPLAIELAAARARVLSVEQISSRLEASFSLLTGGSRTAMARQRTLRAAMDWSHDLLPEKERIPFRRLSVFAGGFALDAAEAVCAGEHFGPEEVLDSLSDLVAKSLVVAAERDGAARYRLLETVRQYGREKLEESGELDLLEERHARHYLALAEEAEPELRGARQGEWLDRLETEHDNLRAALAWTLEVGEAELGLRLGGALGEFWHLRGHLDEGQRWLQAVLTNGGEASEPVRARVLAQAGWIAWEQGDYERAVSLTEKSLALSRKIGDERISALALLVQGMSRMRQGDELERASELIEESVALHRATGDAAGLSRALLGLGIVAVLRGDYEHAATLHEEGLALAREAADNFAINIALMQGALVHLSRGDHRLAVALTEEGLALAWHLRMLHATAAHLDISSGLAGARGQAARSARLWGAAEALRESIGAPISPVERFYFAPLTAAAKSELGEAAWEAELAEGRTMTPEQAVEYALSTHEAAPSSSHDSSSSLLSARETEVLALVAEGLTNPQVAQRLYLSPRTVGQHLRSVYRKLGVSSRAAAVREASERGMI